MKLIKLIKEICKKHPDKKIAMFIDMDGVIASLDIDTNNDISKNTPNYFLKKRPLKTVIEALKNISNISNLDLYILSACGYKEQAADKKLWLKKHAPFFKEENQIFLIKELTNYTKENKEYLKTQHIVDILENKIYDYAIYLEDEYKMLKTAYKKLKDKIYCIHISNLID